MTVDMSQFLQTFYEESFEGLDTMEQELLNLDIGTADQETINTIFRAAHSIKGGAATFGLTYISSFTHVVETLLDEVRDGKRAISEETVNLLLQSVDCIREMIIAGRDNLEQNQTHIDNLFSELEFMLHSDKNEHSAIATSEGNNDNPDSNNYGWHISFHPHIDLFRSGNDPVRILMELESLGKLHVTSDISKLPDFEHIDPEESYIGWYIDITGNIDINSIKDVFAWVEDECDLEITPLTGPSSITDPSKNKQPSSLCQANNGAVVGELVEERRKNDDRRKTVRRTAASTAETTSIRVGIDKVDLVINLVGELVITQSMLSALGDDFDMSRLHKLASGLAQLEQNTRELQEQVMRMRMLPISFAFNRFPRMVHDLAQKLGKKVELKITGEQTELDKTVIEKIGDPLLHLVRNSMDHGIEMPDERIAHGKTETGLVHLDAYHKGGNIIIEVADDGHGLDCEKIFSRAVQQGLVEPDAVLPPERIYDFLFLPGFSTVDVVSDVSGRGVGMDVVRRNIQSMGGTVDITSEKGKGSKFSVRLPLTLAILEGQSIAVGNEIYIIPLVSIIESMQLKKEMLNYIAGKGEVFNLRDEFVPIIRLYDIFGSRPKTTDLTQGLLVVVEGDGHKTGIFVDELLGQQQVVIKSLETNFQRVEGISGATILGDGAVALILDVPGLIRLSHKNNAFQTYIRSA